MSRLHFRPLVLIVATALLGSIGSVAIVPEARAATLLVSSCTDGGIGSLRAVAAAANSGDTIDIRGLVCNQITLTSGAIVIPDQFITIVGAGRKPDPYRRQRQRTRVHASGTWPDGNNATLTLRNLTVQNGLVTGTNPGGGCIYSLRHVRLEHVHLRNCTVRPTNPNIRTGFGAGVASWRQCPAVQQPRFTAIVPKSVARAAGSGRAATISATSTTACLRQLRRQTRGAASMRAGLHDLLDHPRQRRRKHQRRDRGRFLRRPARHQQVDDQRQRVHRIRRPRVLRRPVADFGQHDFGQRFPVFTPAGVSLEARGAPITVRNSTITDNIAVPGFPAPARAPSSTAPSTGKARIIANNFLSGRRRTCGCRPRAAARARPSAATTSSSSATRRLPIDTVRDDPMLAPLANNGGRTRTHAFLPGSPAIDAGNNNANYAFDQRGEDSREWSTDARILARSSEGPSTEANS